MKTIAWPLVVLLFVASPPTRAAEEVTAEDRRAAAQEKQTAISALSQQLDALESSRKKAAQARRIEEAKELAQRIRETRGSLEEWESRSDEDRAIELARERADRARERVDRERREQLQRERTQEVAAREDRLKAAREAAGCPIVIQELRVKRYDRDDWGGKTVGMVDGFYGQYYGPVPYGFHCLFEVNNASDREIAAWEIKIESLDAFGKVIEDEVYQGLSLSPGGAHSHKMKFDRTANASVARVTINRVAFADGQVWNRAAHHRGVSATCSREDGTLRWDIDHPPPQDGANAALPAVKGEMPAPAPGKPVIEPRPNMVGPLQQLAVGERIVANLGKYGATVSQGGELVVYRTADESRLWATGTNDPAGAELAMLEDGNAVLRNREGKILWSSGTAGNPGACLFVQDDGNFCVYADKEATRVLWAAGCIDR